MIAEKMKTGWGKQSYALKATAGTVETLMIMADTCGHLFYRAETAPSIYICEFKKSALTLLGLILLALRCLSLNTSKSGVQRATVRGFVKKDTYLLLLWGMGCAMCIFQVHRICCWLFVCLSV